MRELAAITPVLRRALHPRASAARATGLDVMVLAAIASGLLARLLPHTPVRVVVYDQLRAVIWPILPMIPAGLLPAAASEFASARIRLAARPPHILRAAYAALVALVALVALCIAPRTQQTVLSRNTLFMIGLGLLATTWLPGSIAWAPVVLLPSTMWLLGWIDVGHAHTWAWLLQPANNTLAQLVTAPVFCIGIATFTMRGPRFRAGPSRR